MICPNCLANNKNTAIKCKSCGASLVSYDKHPEEHRSPRQNQSAQKMHRPQDPFKVEDITFGEDDTYDDNDNADQPTIVISPMRDEPLSGRSRSAARVPNEDGFIAQPSGHLRKPIRKSRRVFNTAATIVLWVIVLGLIGAAVYAGFKFLPGLISPLASLPPVAESTPPPFAPPVISASVNDEGMQYLHCVFYGTDGDQIYISQTRKFHDIADGKVEFDLQLTDFITADTVINTETVDVAIGAKYRTADGHQYDIDVPMQKLILPETNINLISPDSYNNEVYKSECALVFSVDDGTTVYINDVKSNDKLVQGKISYTVLVPMGTSTTVNIRALSPFHRTTEISVTFTRNELATKLTLAGSNPKITDQMEFSISGVVQPGATVTSDYKIKDVVVNQTTGAFTCKLTLPGYGKHDVLITSTYRNDSATVAYSVLCNPNEDAYTRGVWRYDRQIADTPGTFMGKSFLFSGVKIIEFYQAEDTLFLIDMGTEGDSQEIYVEYYGSRSLNTDTTYRIFGDVIGTYSGKALIAARFIYSP